MADREADGDAIDWVERAPAAGGAVFIPTLWLWHTRGEWSMAVPAFLLATALGLVGVGAYWLLAGRRREGTNLDAWGLSGAVPVAVASAAAAWYTEGGLGWRPALGSVTAGLVIACWLLFVRISVWGLPEGEGSSD